MQIMAVNHGELSPTLNYNLLYTVAGEQGYWEGGRILGRLHESLLNLEN